MLNSVYGSSDGTGVDTGKAISRKAFNAISVSPVKQIVKVSSVKYTIMFIVMHRFEDRCHNSMHSYVNIVSKSVYHGSNVLFLGVLSNHVVTGVG